VSLCARGRIDIHEGWLNLPKLTSLKLQGILSNYDRIASLPALKDLDLHFLGSRLDDPLQLVAPHSLCGLTSLAIQSTESIDQVNPETYTWQQWVTPQALCSLLTSVVLLMGWKLSDRHFSAESTKMGAGLPRFVCMHNHDTMLQTTTQGVVSSPGRVCLNNIL